ncbi:cupin-like domain-containing protein [Paraglaciecola agarilytica]|uniref:cupin-like domain-containing protein n=1 Tax=Paraglaciecola chathamensis TaxID=368405 RepID=UPI001C08F81E|nr:cupin-like domain-containing protein [Paraglaciecola agarilytica]MBU3017689.1 cupin-like domain-containing protein [Paraglaciecola agarilytica]
MNTDVPLSNAKQTAQEVKYLEGISPKNIPSVLLNSHEPIVLKGYCNYWPLVKAAKQSDEAAKQYLLQFDEGENFHTHYLPSAAQGRVFYNQDMTGFNFASKQQKLPKLLDDILQTAQSKTGECVYVSATSLAQSLPSLLKQIETLPDITSPLVNIWLGNASRIAAHYDFAQNFACCVVGKRRFTLFPPEQLKNLYVGPLDKAPGGQEISTVDVANPDLAEHPKYSEALEAAQVAELEPGDALILPSMWWHHVQGLSAFNVLITHWWRDSPAQMGRPMNALLLAMMSVRDLPTHQRDAWKNLFDHYVFAHQPENFSHIPEAAKSILASPMDDISLRKLRAELQNKLRR